MIHTSKPSRRRPQVARTLAALCLAGAVASFGAAAANANTTVVRTPQSIECSKQADAKGLHGKERETFRSECKRNAKTSEALPMPKPAPVKAQ